MDGGVSVVMPEPGESVFAEAMSPRRSERLEVSNPVGDALVLDDVGSDSGAQETYTTQSSGLAACRDAYRNQWNMRLYHYLRYYFNRRSIPSYLADVGVASPREGWQERQRGEGQLWGA